MGKRGPAFKRQQGWKQPPALISNHLETSWWSGRTQGVKLGAGGGDAVWGGSPTPVPYVT